MQKHLLIQDYIRQAQAERSAYLAALLKSALHRAWKVAGNHAEALFSVARARTHKGIFTFDA